MSDYRSVAYSASQIDSESDGGGGGVNRVMCTRGTGVSLGNE